MPDYLYRYFAILNKNIEKVNVAEEAEIELLIQRHFKNQAALVGYTIQCANCGKEIAKTSYQTQFCSNKGKDNCKDAYWNKVIPGRRK